jgi:hypothetical protein
MHPVDEVPFKGGPEADVTAAGEENAHAHYPPAEEEPPLEDVPIIRTDKYLVEGLEANDTERDADKYRPADAGRDKVSRRKRFTYNYRFMLSL